MSRISKSTETKCRLVDARSWRERKWGVTVSGYRISFGDDENVLELVVMISQLGEYTKNH